MKTLLVMLVVVVTGAALSHRPVCAEKPGDWPMLGRTFARNPVVPEGDAPIEWNIKTGQNFRWSAKLGSQTYGTPVIADGHVYIGTNNGAGNLERYPATVDLGCLLCFRESDGTFLWQFSAEKLPQGRIADWPLQGIGCPPYVEGERLWFVSNRWEVVCLDTQGFRDDENDGPFDNESVVGSLEADVIWKFDLIKNLNMYPHTAGMGPDRRSSIAAFGDNIYLVTGNGVAVDHFTLPTPEAPSLICLNKNTGNVIWVDHSPGKNILHTQVASPLVAKIAGREQVIVPQGDGWLRSFEATTGKLLWEFDMNPKHSKWNSSGSGTRNNILATPVLYENRIYIANGQEMEHGEGPGRLVCIDPTKDGDISSELAVDADDKVIPHRRTQAVNPDKGEKAIPNPNSGLVWEFRNNEDKYDQTMHRMISSVAVHDGLVVAADGFGLVHCLSAQTGEQFWGYDVLAAIWSAPLIVGDIVYVPDEDAKVSVFRLSSDPRRAMKPGDSGQAFVRGKVRDFVPIAEVEVDSSVHTSPVFANGVLYIATKNRLYAIAHDESEQAKAESDVRDNSRLTPGPASRRNESDGRRVPKSAFVPTPPDVVERMLDLAELKEGEVVCDLGSGDGRILIMAARKYAARAIGFEIDDELVTQSRKDARAAGVANRVTVHNDDLFNADLSNVDVLTLYLYPVQNRKLLPRLQKLPDGVRILTHQFELPGVRAEATQQFESTASGETHLIYRYTTPLVSNHRQD